MKPILEYDYWLEEKFVNDDTVMPEFGVDLEDFMCDFGKLIKSMSLDDVISVDGEPKNMRDIRYKKEYSEVGWDWLDQVFGGGYSGWNYNNVKNIEVYKTKNGIDVVLGNREPCKIRKVESKP